jgi:hypothetical protein
LRSPGGGQPDPPDASFRLALPRFVSSDLSGADLSAFTGLFTLNAVCIEIIRPALQFLFFELIRKERDGLLQPFA